MKRYIRLHFRNCTPDVAVLEGLRPAGTSHDAGEAYEAGAVVPGAVRRELSSSEETYFFSRHAWPPSACISIFPIPDGVLNELTQIAGTSAPGASGLGAELWQSLEAQTPLRSLDDPQWLGFARRPGSLATTTIDSTSRRRVGLHIDSWDRLPTDERNTARVRVCINVGMQSRYLLAVPFEVCTLVEALRELDDANGIKADPRKLVGSFAKECPGVQVLEIEVPPGYAYLAPTENMIHDGACPGPNLDITATWLGRITLGRPAVPSSGEDRS